MLRTNTEKSGTAIKRPQPVRDKQFLGLFASVFVQFPAKSTSAKHSIPFLFLAYRSHRVLLCLVNICNCT